MLRMMDPFWIWLLYFPFISCFGFWVLVLLKKPTITYGFDQPKNLDLFFTSVSASTVCSMSTVEMEVFSNSQLLVLTVLMFIGGEVFTSILGLQLRNCRKVRLSIPSSVIIPRDSSSLEDQLTKFDHDHQPAADDQIMQVKMKYNSIKFLGYVALAYLLAFHFLGIAMVLVYLKHVSMTAREVLEEKGLKMWTFTIFLIVSTFSSCGFVPTNENMMVFSKNSGLLVILIPQALVGNTLFPCCLRVCIWSLGKLMKKSEGMTRYLLTNSEEIGYLHLLPKLHSLLLAATVGGFVVIQLVVIGSMEWTSKALSGLNFVQKLIGIFFLSINSRHTGESILDLSTLSPPILLLFLPMMLVPPSLSFN